MICPNDRPTSLPAYATREGLTASLCGVGRLPQQLDILLVETLQDHLAAFPFSQHLFLRGKSADDASSQFQGTHRLVAADPIANREPKNAIGALSWRSATTLQKWLKPASDENPNATFLEKLQIQNRNLIHGSLYIPPTIFGVRPHPIPRYYRLDITSRSTETSAGFQQIVIVLSILSTFCTNQAVGAYTFYCCIRSIK
ncbi:hypothetical protein ACLOJK_025968 [Asimina triloba]